METGTDFDRIARRIRLLVLDVDGVLTDGSIVLDGADNEWKAFHVRDGHAMKIAGRAGLQLAVITGRRSGVVERRMSELGIRELHQGVFDKVSVCMDLLRKTGLTEEETAFMGDDVVDIPLLDRVALPAAPADADEAVLKRVFFVSRQPGGRGAVRDLIQRILQAQGSWDRVVLNRESH